MNFVFQYSWASVQCDIAQHQPLNCKVNNKNGKNAIHNKKKGLLKWQAQCQAQCQ